VPSCQARERPNASPSGEFFGQCQGKPAFGSDRIPPLARGAGEPQPSGRCTVLRLVKSLTIAMTIVLALAASGAARERPRGVVADCAMQSGASFPGAFSSSRNVVVGPLAMIGARGTPPFSSSFHGQKFPLLVKVGHRVTLELSITTRRGAALGYGPLPQGDVGLREAHRVITFIACRRGASDSEADGKPVTFWSGGVLVRSPRCVPLRVWIDRASSPRRVVIRLGVDRCG
jgi:hypothetical protein